MRSALAPQRAKAIALKDKFKFKAEMDDEAQQHHVPPSQDQGGLKPGQHERAERGHSGHAITRGPERF